MSAYWELAISLICALLAFSAGGALAALGLAIASYRFAGLSGNGERVGGELSAAAKYCVYNSNRIAPAISLGRRIAYFISALCVYFCCDAAFKICGVELGGGRYLLSVLSAAVFALFVQYSLFDIPASLWGRAHPVCVLTRFSILLYIFYMLALPFDFFARKLARKVMGKRAKNATAAFDYIEVAMMLRAEDSDTDSISPYTGKIVKNALRLQELDVSDVMLPRSKVVYLDTESSQKENIELAAKTRHTRYPLCKGDLDNCFGIVNIKNIFMSNIESEDVNLREICRETLRLKENEKLEGALAKMLKYRLHMALVEDEFGGVIGVITLDAPLSELVGKIRDEFDSGSDQSIKALGKNRYKVQGLTSLHMVEDFLDIDFGDVDVSTFGGLITFRLGRFPEKGERIYFKEQRMRVTIDAVADRVVSEATVQLEDPSAEEEI